MTTSTVAIRMVQTTMMIAMLTITIYKDKHTELAAITDPSCPIWDGIFPAVLLCANPPIHVQYQYAQECAAVAEWS